MADPAPAGSLLECPHHAAGRCRSCTWLGVPLPEQVARKVAHARALVDRPGLVWEDPVTQPGSGFRNKAKMAVAGTLENPTLGLVAPDGTGTDLRDCALHSPALIAAMEPLARFIGTARLTPYDLPTRTGELKHLLVTASEAGELMVRFVVRSREAETRIRKHLPTLRSWLPGVRVVSLNVQPEHKAVLEGPVEIVLSDEVALPMQVRTGQLLLRPQSFFQTSTAVAAELYATAARWTEPLAPGTVWDLYCGVGGFARALAAPGREVLGVEISAEAVAAGNADAPEGVRFTAGDATAFARSAEVVPDLVVLNPPRRGIGAELAGWIEASGVPHVLYSSCRAETMAEDLAVMASYTPRRARVLDMFPQTPHQEVLVLLGR